VDDVERWIPGARIRRDLFGFADLIAFNATDVLLVQVTTGSNTRAREKKILASEHARAWCEGETRELVVVGWKEYKRADEDGEHWRPKLRWFSPEDWSA